MAVLSKGNNFADGDQVTSSTLDALVDSATFVSGATGTTDDSSLEVNGSGRLQVKSLGINTGHIASSAITAAKIADTTITPGKLSTGAPTWDTSSNLTVTGNISLTKSNTQATLTVLNTTTGATPYAPTVLVSNNAGSLTNAPPALILRKARGSSSSPTAIQSSDVISQITSQAYDGSANTSCFNLLAVATENFTGSAAGTSIRLFGTDTGSNTLTLRMAWAENGNVGVGTNAPSDKAILHLSSTTKGFLPPVMTTVQRDAITSPPEGLMVYNTTTNKLNFYNGSSWEAVTSA